MCCLQNNGNITPSPFNDVLGPNGYYVFSAYDLDPKPEDGGFMCVLIINKRLRSHTHTRACACACDITIAAELLLLLLLLLLLWLSVLLCNNTYLPSTTRWLQASKHCCKKKSNADTRTFSSIF